VTPTARRAAVGWLREQFAFSERRACVLVGIERSTARYQGRSRLSEEHLRGWLRELAAEHPRFGYRRLHLLLRRAGMIVNHKRVARLYRAEGLAVRRCVRKRVAHNHRVHPSVPIQPNEQWAADFVSDALSWGRSIRLFAVLDVCTREALAIEVDTSLPGARVVRVLDQLTSERGVPHELMLDNGPELTGRALDQWAYEQGLRLHFIEPGKPVQNAVIESFIGRLRDECLNQHWFVSLADARRIVEAWRLDYNRCRPHSALGYRTPAEMHAAFTGDGINGTLVTRQELVGLSE
jgi:putative transposase